jgi:hypothetical protein
LLIPTALIYQQNNPFRNKTKLNDYLLGGEMTNNSLDHSQGGISSHKNSIHLTSKLSNTNDSKIGGCVLAVPPPPTGQKVGKYTSPRV